jgi:polycomb protein EED
MPDGTFEPLQVYVDENRDENYYTCAWSFNEETREPIVAAAGLHGIIRLLNCVRQDASKFLLGHGNSINDLKFHPTDPNLLLSASKDESVRLWNTKTLILVAILAGDGGHRGEVISVSYHLDGNQLASSGMDNCVKIWSLLAIKDTITKSYEPLPADATCPFPTRTVQIPTFSTTRVHNNYVDCVGWYAAYEPHAEFLVCAAVKWQWLPSAQAGRLAVEQVDAQ